MSEADKAVANGLRNGNYTAKNFTDESYQYEQVLFGLLYKAPGISQSADSSWISSIDHFYTNVRFGIFTF